MKLSKVTIEILRNLATINQGILFKPGNKLRTISVMKSTFVMAEIPDEIPVEFAIYDLNEFLGVLSLKSDPDITFLSDHMIISEGNQETEFYYSSPNVIVSPGDKNITLQSEDKKFQLTKETFDTIVRHSNMMKLKDLSIDCNGIKVFNRDGTGLSNKHTIKIPVECSEDKQLQSLIKVENLKMIPVDYDVIISNKGISCFTSKSQEYKICYYITLDFDSN